MCYRDLVMGLWGPFRGMPWQGDTVFSRASGPRRFCLKEGKDLLGSVVLQSLRPAWLCKPVDYSTWGLCPSLSAGVCSNSGRLSQCYPNISSSVTPWTIALQHPLSMGFPRQEYWSGLPFPSPGDLPDPGIEPRSPHCGQTLYLLSHHIKNINEILRFSTCTEYFYSVINSNSDVYFTLKAHFTLIIHISTA